MKIFLSTLAITLAITFMATPSDALDNLAKCQVYNAKIKMNYSKCLEQNNLLAAKTKPLKTNCESKRFVSLEKANDKFVTKLGVNADDCRIDSAPATEDQVRQLFGSGAALTQSQIDALSSDTIIEIIVAGAEQAGCEAAGGTWENAECTPAPVAVDGPGSCERAGFCGVSGWNHGLYVGVDRVTAGCDNQAFGANLAYSLGVLMYECCLDPSICQQLVAAGLIADFPVGDDCSTTIPGQGADDICNIDAFN